MPRSLPVPRNHVGLPAALRSVAAKCARLRQPIAERRRAGPWHGGSIEPPISPMPRICAPRIATRAGALPRRRELDPAGSARDARCPRIFPITVGTSSLAIALTLASHCSQVSRPNARLRRWGQRHAADPRTKPAAAASRSVSGLRSSSAARRRAAAAGSRRVSSQLRAVTATSESTNESMAS